jgi:DNA-binding PadR family transcriptional regulator
VQEGTPQRVSQSEPPSDSFHRIHSYNGADTVFPAKAEKTRSPYPATYYHTLQRKEKLFLRKYIDRRGIYVYDLSRKEGERMTISADLLRGYTDTIIMRQLAAGDGYGYGISRAVAEKSDGMVLLKEATLYTAFRRMEENGLIRSYWGDENTGARRRYYSLTEPGKTKLAEEKTAWEETRRVMDTLLG